MTTKTFRTRKARKGIVGIEAAIVLIAFVIVAAALAFVTLNMGFFTTQKSKEAMGSSLKEASSALEVDGSVLGQTSSNQLTKVAIPLKLSSGKNPIDLSKTIVTIRTPTKAVTLTNIVINTTTTESDPFTALGTNAAAFIGYVNDGDKLLETNEKWFLVIDLSNSNVLGAGLDPYTSFTVEIKPPTGAPLTVERMVPPNLSETVIVLEG
ncbi:MAG: flagellin [Desulfurococcales archaeon ex4484_217_2]|nr:MAG: flagellin [Desulfurococcales archaeon ex4484_217_2]